MLTSHGRWGLRLTLLTVSAVLLSGYGGWFRPSLFGAVPAVMTLAYPLVVVLALAVCIGLLLACRWLLAAVVALAIVATGPSLRANFPLNVTPSGAQTADTFRVMSYNVASFSDKLWTDRTQMHPAMRLILDEDADFVILLQPVGHGVGYNQRKSINPWLAELDRHYPYRTHSSNDEVELLSKHPFRVQPLAEPGRVYRYFPYVIESISRFAFDIRLPDSKQLRIIAAHMTSFMLAKDERRVLDSVIVSSPWPLYAKLDTAFVRRERMSRVLRDSIDKSPANVILCADVNDVPQSFAYRTLRGHDMRDAFAECHTGYLNTFNAHNMLFHIDHILYRGSLRATGFKCLRVPFSDHYPIVATFAWLCDE